MGCLKLRSLGEGAKGMEVCQSVDLGQKEKGQGLGREIRIWVRRREVGTVKNRL